MVGQRQRHVRPSSPSSRRLRLSTDARLHTQDEMAAKRWDGGVDAEARLSVVRSAIAAVTHCAPPTPMTLTPLPLPDPLLLLVFVG